MYDWNQTQSRVPKKLSSQELEEFRSATNCSSCGCSFNGIVKCQDHDHMTGMYRSALCSECNLKMRLSRNKLPVFFHNLMNYDGHFVVQSLSRLNEKHKFAKFDVLPLSSEKYISIECKHTVSTYKNKNNVDTPVQMSVQFKDTALFIPASLDNLVKQLNPTDLHYSSKLLSNVVAHKNPKDPSDSLELILRKGIFPYEYFNSLERCKETKLPSIECFYDNLNKRACTQSDYAFALKAWNTFECRTFNDYLLLYLQQDVYQLADVFERFRDVAIKQDSLDPAHYLTIPSFSWDSALKMTSSKIQLLHDYEMHRFFERGIRGGITFVNIHHSVINSPIHPETFEENLPLNELLYVDANNLYGRALSMPLPLRDFRWLSSEEIQNLDISSLDLESGNKGFVFEVDLCYPTNIQDLTEDLPFAPEPGIAAENTFSEYMINLHEMLYSKKKYHPSRKLLLTHGDKKNYVIHGLLLQFYLKHGMVLEKIHKAVEFHQEAFFKPYIEFNSSKRQQSTSSIEKDYFKLKNNSVFGKTSENVQNRINLKLVTNEGLLKKFSTHPSHKRTLVFNKDLAGVYLQLHNVLLNKPIQIGQAVLDISKFFMYRWRYEIFPQYEKKLDCKIRILGGDTDSFFLSVENTSVYDKLLPLLKNDGYLDTSNYPDTHPLYSLDLKADLNCIKDESEGRLFKEFLLLKPKCYSMKYLDSSSKEIKKAKGVRRVTLANEITFSDYFEVFKFIQKEVKKWQTRISSKKHNVSTINYCKKVLSVWEDKRVWLSPNQSLPYGNHQLNNRTLPKPVNAPRSSLPPRIDIPQPTEEDEEEEEASQ